MRQFKLHVLANYGGQGLAAGLQFLAIPAYLHFLGAAAYGVIGFLLALQLALLFLDLGFSATASREVARTGNDLEQSARVIDTLEWIYLATAAVILGLFLLAASPLAKYWLASDAFSSATIAQTIGIFGLYAALRWPVTLYSGVLRGFHRHFEVNLSNAAASLVRVGGSITVLALFTPSLQLLVGWLAGSAVLELVLMRLLVMRATQRPFWNIPSWNAAVLSSVWKFSAVVAGTSLAAAVLKQTDKVIVPKLEGLVEAGHYAVCADAARLTLLLGAPIFNASFPKLSSLVEKGDFAEAARVYHFSASLGTTLVAPCALALALFPRELLLIWTRDEVLASAGMTILPLLAIGAILNSLVQTPYALQLAFALNRINLTYNVLAAVLFVPFCWFMTVRFGLVGAAFAWLVNTLLYALIVPAVVHRHALHGQWMRWALIDSLLPVLVGLACLGAARALSHSTSNQFATVGLIVLAVIAAIGISTTVQRKFRFAHRV